MDRPGRQVAAAQGGALLRPARARRRPRPRDRRPARRLLRGRRPAPTARRSSSGCTRSSTRPTASSPRCTRRSTGPSSPRWTAPTSTPWPSSLEEVVDAVFATALQFVVHAMEDLPDGSCELAALIRQACEAIQAAVTDLRGMKNPAGIRERCELLDRLESEGDRIYRTQLAAMFRTETDAIRLIKHKEFLEGPGADARRLRRRGRRPADHRHQERLRPAVNTALLILVLVVVAALAFDYINGFHDAANAVATVVSTGVLPLRTAILLAAVLNFAGRLRPARRWPRRSARGWSSRARSRRSSSSSALLGAIALEPGHLVLRHPLVVVARPGRRAGRLGHGPRRRPVDPGRRPDQGGREPGRQPARRVRDRLRADDRHPLDLPARAARPGCRRTFRRLQIVSAGFMALSHGSNDAQKTMGIIAMSLAVYSGAVAGRARTSHVPLWVMVACAVAMGAGDDGRRASGSSRRWARRSST